MKLSSIKEQPWWPRARLIGNIIFYVAIAVILFVRVRSMIPQQDAYKPAPRFESTDIMTGETVSLDGLSNKVVLMNYWATWCPPCQKEIPDLIRLQNTYPDQVQVIGVALDKQSPQFIRNFAQNKGINYPVLVPDDPRLMQYGSVRSIPTSFVVDREGNISRILVGFRTYVFFEAAVKKFFPAKEES